MKAFVGSTAALAVGEAGPILHRQGVADVFIPGDHLAESISTLIGAEQA